MYRRLLVNLGATSMSIISRWPLGRPGGAFGTFLGLPVCIEDVGTSRGLSVHLEVCHYVKIHQYVQMVVGMFGNCQYILGPIRMSGRPSVHLEGSQ